MYNIKMDLKEICCENARSKRVSGSCSVTGFGINGFELSES